MASPLYELPEITAGQDGAEVTHNDANRRVEAFGPTLLLQSTGTNTPPVSPTDGQVWMTGAAPTGAWAGEATKLALYSAGWLFLAPPTGQIASVPGSSTVVVWAGAAWETIYTWGEGG
jgi:hypothetical protein